MRSNRFKYDAFVSHAVEDKIGVANELCVRLEQAGLRLWYSGKKLKIGDSLEKSIDAALDQSRYGIVVLSPTYLGKSWPRKEYYMLKAKEAECGKVILPVLYGITMEELQKSDIHIADRWAIPIDEKGMDSVVQKLVEEIRPGLNQPKRSVSNIKAFLKNTPRIGILAMAVILLFYVAYSTLLKKDNVPPLDFVHQAIDKHVNTESSKFKQWQEGLLADLEARSSTKEDIANVFTKFASINSNYRNEYELRYSKRMIRSRKNVEKELNIDLPSLTPQNDYNLNSPNIFLATETNGQLLVAARYLLVNTKPVTYNIIKEDRTENGGYTVTVAYEEYIHVFFVSLLFPSKETHLKRHQMVIIGLPPKETFVFHSTPNGWELDRVE